MSKGGKYDEEHSEQLMFTRIALQAFAVVMLLVAVYITAAWSDPTIKRIKGDWSI